MPLEFRPRRHFVKIHRPPVLPRTAVCGKLISFSVGDEIGVSDMCMMDEIIAKRDEIYAIARKHKAEKLWVFGSRARRKELA